MKRCAARCSLAFCSLIISTALQVANAAEQIEIRAKADAPAEADREGYSVAMIDSHTDHMLVDVHARVPESFGPVEGAQLVVRDESGAGVCTVPVERSLATQNGIGFEFGLRRDFLRNSRLVVGRWSGANGLASATFLLGTFTIRDHPKAGEMSKPRPVRAAIAEFGRIEDGLADNIIPASRIVREEGQRYGMRLYLRGNGRSVPVRVEMECPTAPKSWGGPDAAKELVISSDGRTSSLTRLVPTEKLLEFNWEVLDGDPLGEYEIRVFVHDQLLKAFRFLMVQPEG